MQRYALRRINNRTQPAPHTVVPESIDDPPLSVATHKQRTNTAFRRIERYQKRWLEIGKELPPQINRRHISVISIGGVIGTGLYIGTATAIIRAGPVGTLIGYMITGTIVWSVVISIGEIVSFLPNVGGPVGLAGLYVDPALGFALGWNAWYTWSIILPTELSAAAILFNGFFPDKNEEFIRRCNIVAITTVLFFAIFINCFGAHAYGEIEFFFSCFKILTIISLIIAGLVLDLGGGKEGFIGIKNWRNPGPFVEFRAFGALGKFLGVWTSMNQAVFAFFGTEIPGVAAGEVQNPATNIPRATNRVWIRITLFYVLAVFFAGLLVPSDHPDLKGPSAGSPGKTLVLSSPFVIALRNSDFKHADLVCNAAFFVSAFSAAVSDVYISSRILYYLGRCRHAPEFCTRIYRSKSHNTVLPWVGILGCVCFGLLSYMSISESSADNIFHWLSSMNSTTALLSWTGMLFTYLRWYQGTKAAEKNIEGFKKAHEDDLYKNRYKLQPWIAIYALVMCILILAFNGWFVFTRPGPWRMGEFGPSRERQALASAVLLTQGSGTIFACLALELDDPPIGSDPEIGNWVPTFVSSYLALPVFVLLVLGYKLVYRTRMVPLDKMVFERGIVPVIKEPSPTTRWGKLLATIF